MGHAIKKVGKVFKNIVRDPVGAIATGGLSALTEAALSKKKPVTPLTPAQIFQASRAPIYAPMSGGSTPATLLTQGQTGTGAQLGSTSLLGG